MDRMWNLEAWRLSAPPLHLLNAYPPRIGSLLVCPCVRACLFLRLTRATPD